MNKKNSKVPFYKNKMFLIITFWVIVIGLVVALNENILRNGEEVFLETQPYDPRDLFRGDYMVLRYDISMISADDASLPDGIGVGDAVYVRLSVDEESVARPIAVLKTAPSEGLYIKGQTTWVNEISIRVDYGIESYFIPEATGRNWPRITEVKVAIDGSGRSRIKGVYNDFVEINPDDINQSENKGI